MTDNASFIRTLTQDDFDTFAAISGDDNPIHVDAAFAARTRFGATVAHGMFLYSLLESLADKVAPGAQISASAMMFPAPARCGEAIEFSARREGTQLLLTARRVEDGEDVCRLTLDLAETAT